MAQPRVVRAGHAESVRSETSGSVFSGTRFWITQRCPQRSTFIAAVRDNGGIIELLEDRADIKIADHLRPNPPTNSYSYKFIEQSIAQGSMVDLDQHRIDAPPRSSRPVGSSKPTKAGREPFTAEDERILWNFVQDQIRAGEKALGNRIYKDLEAINPRHTYQSWRDHYKNFTSKNPPPSGAGRSAPPKPPTPPSDNHAELVPDETLPDPLNAEQHTVAEPRRPETDHANIAKPLPAKADTASVPQDPDEQLKSLFNAEDYKFLLKNAPAIKNVRWVNWKVMWHAVVDFIKRHPEFSQRTADEWEQFWTRIVFPAYEKRQDELSRRRSNGGRASTSRVENFSDSAGASKTPPSLRGSPFGVPSLGAGTHDQNSKKRKSAEVTSEQSEGSEDDVAFSKRRRRRQRKPSEELGDNEFIQPALDIDNTGPARNDQSESLDKAATEVINLIDSSEERDSNAIERQMKAESNAAQKQFSIFEDEDMDETQNGEQENLILAENRSPSFNARHRHERSAEALEVFGEAPMHFGLVSAEGDVIHTSQGKDDELSKEDVMEVDREDSVEDPQTGEAKIDNETAESSEAKSPSGRMSSKLQDTATQAILEAATQNPDLMMNLPEGEEADDEDDGPASGSEIFHSPPPNYEPDSATLFIPQTVVETQSFDTLRDQRDLQAYDDGDSLPDEVDVLFESVIDRDGNLAAGQDEESSGSESEAFFVTQGTGNTQAILQAVSIDPELDLPPIPEDADMEDDEASEGPKDEIVQRIRNAGRLQPDLEVPLPADSTADSDQVIIVDTADVDDEDRTATNDNDDSSSEGDMSEDDEEPQETVLPMSGEEEVRVSDADLPSSPPAQRLVSPAQRLVSPAQSPQQRRNRTPPPASNAPISSDVSPERVAHDTTIIRHWLDRQQAIYKRPEQRLIYALQRTTMDTSLAEVVLASVEKGEGCPQGVVGIWTEAEDAIMTAGRSGSLGQALDSLRSFHGELAFEDRMQALQAMEGCILPPPA